MSYDPSTHGRRISEGFAAHMLRRHYPVSSFSEHMDRRRNEEEAKQRGRRCTHNTGGYCGRCGY